MSAQVRLEALKLAVVAGGDEDVLDRAEKFEKYINGIKPKVTVADGESLPDLIVNILKEQNRPLSNHEITEFVKKAKFGRDKAGASTNYVQTAISRLVSRQVVTKNQKGRYTATC